MEAVKACEEKCAVQGVVVRDLKTAGKDVGSELEKLLALKKELSVAYGVLIDDLKKKDATEEITQQIEDIQAKKDAADGKKVKKKKTKKNPVQPKPQVSDKNKPSGLSKKEANKLAKKDARKKAKKNEDIPPPTAVSEKKQEKKAEAKKAEAPLLAMLTASYLGVKATLQGDKVTIENTLSLRGNYAVARYLTRTVPSGKSLYDESEPKACYEVDQWLEFCAANGSLLKGNRDYLTVLNSHLSLRTYMCGYGLSIADFALYCCLGADGWTSKKGEFVHLERWESLLTSNPSFAQFKKAHFSQAKQKSSGGKRSEGKKDDVAQCPPLPGVKEGQLVVTRFPPEPSGHLHIGHAKAIFLNQYYAQRYNGRMLLRFDDTNPSKEKEEFEHGIIEDLEHLNIIPYKVSWTSDHFKLLNKYAIQLIEQGDAYMDNTNPENMKQQRDEGINSINRDNSVERNMEMFNEMHSGSEEGQKWCLRAKMDMQSVNKCLRDPVFFRSNILPHARTKATWKAYPTYDLACPIVDSIEGVTHAMRDMNYKDRVPLYEWVIKKLKLRPVILHDFSRMNFVSTLLSKRKLGWFVEEGKVDGWDDPRFPTIKGVLRRGCQVESLYKFMVAQGASRKEGDMEWDKFWNFNKKVIDPIVPRYMAVDAVNNIILELEDVKELRAKTYPRHPKDKNGEQHGVKTLFLAPRIFLEYGDVHDDKSMVQKGEEVLLMQWGVIEITDVEVTDGKVLSLKGKTKPGANVSAPKRKIHWLADTPHVVKAKIFEFDYLITKPKIEPDEDFKAFINPHSVAETLVLAEAGLKTVREDQCMQLLRRGYYRVDKAYQNNSDEIHLFTIPDGKSKAVSTFATASAKMKHR